MATGNSLFENPKFSRQRKNSGKSRQIYLIMRFIHVLQTQDALKPATLIVSSYIDMASF